MSVDIRTRERILKAVEDVRMAIVRQNTGGSPKSARPDRAHAPDKLHLMLPKPHRPIW